MSSRNVSKEIAALLDLVNAGLDESQRIAESDVQQFIAGVSGAGGSIAFNVNNNQCAVVVALERFNEDPAVAHTIQRRAAGENVTEALPAQWVEGDDVFYVFPPGAAGFTFAGNALAGHTFYARTIGYYLPQRALSRLSRISTRIFG